MKKFILFLVTAMVSIAGFGQGKNSIQSYEAICDCHSEYQKGYAWTHKKGSVNNDTILYFSNINIYNSYIDRVYTFYHYNVDFYSQLNLANLANCDSIVSSVPNMIAYQNYKKYLEIERDFKHGFIENWSWSTNSVNGINFNISYTNTNSKTIKYIDIYFIIKNPVGDICKIYYNRSNVGHLRCVGPIEYSETGVYSWDAVYYTTGDASNLYFTKFIITYMDGTKYTLVKELAYKY